MERLRSKLKFSCSIIQFNNVKDILKLNTYNYRISFSYLGTCFSKEVGGTTMSYSFPFHYQPEIATYAQFIHSLVHPFTTICLPINRLLKLNVSMDFCGYNYVLSNRVLIDNDVLMFLQIVCIELFCSYLEYLEMS